MPSAAKVPVYPPIAVQMRRRWWIRASVFTAVSLVFCTILLDHVGCFGYHGDDWAHFDRKTIVVTQVIDPCTVSIRTTDTNRTATVHLLGTDVPSGGAATAATSYTVSSLQEKTAILRLDALQPRDSAGHLLAYLYLNDTDVFNLDLVREGFAYSDHRANHLLRAPMDAAESDARKHARGLWKDVTEAQMPAWRQQWLRDLREHHHMAE